MEITPIIKEDFLVFDQDEVLSQVIGKLRQNEKRAGLIFRNKKYLGVIEKKRLLRSRLDATSIKAGNYIHHTPIINEHADIIETAYTLFQSDVDFLPVEQNKKIVGVLQALDLVNLAMDLPELKKLKVNDVKIMKSIEVQKDDPLARALDVMFLKRVDQVPVLDNGNIFGIISYRDVLRKYLNWSPKREHSKKFNKEVASTRSAEVDIPNLVELPVHSFSTNDNLVTTSQDSSLRDVVALMVKRNVSSALVTSGQKIQGLLTVKNILRSIGSLKIPPNFNIKFIGLGVVDLNSYQKQNVKKVASNEAFKLQRMIHNEFRLSIHLKEYEKNGKDGKQHKYSVTMRVEFPGQIITSTQDDWDAITAVRKTFDNAKNVVKKKFKEDISNKNISNKKYYG
ncbi:CBS domain-containing protein [Candidatus Woesearchaeota archaeon]|nr:CBS domain-containing protein [Candidatus Woesearchaeota archaeon]